MLRCAAAAIWSVSRAVRSVASASSPSRRRTPIASPATLTRLDPWFPGDPATGILGESFEDAILFEEFANNEPCPALDLTTGTCDLYEARPVLCRTFGPPMRTEEDNLATCELCYIHASTEEIAACELDPGIPALEEESNAAYEQRTGRHGQTLVAYALGRSTPAR
jgi:Fe-S-cluster containining protein